MRRSALIDPVGRHHIPLPKKTRVEKGFSVEMASFIQHARPYQVNALLL